MRLKRLTINELLYLGYLMSIIVIYLTRYGVSKVVTTYSSGSSPITYPLIIYSLSILIGGGLLVLAILFRISKSNNIKYSLVQKMILILINPAVGTIYLGLYFIYILGKIL